MSQFQIESYKVSLSSSALNRYDAALFLQSAPAYHGIVTRATLHFTTDPPAFIGGVIGYALNVGSYEGPTMQIIFPAHLFEEAYDLVRSEKPVYLNYALRDLPENPASSSKMVDWAEVTTALEVPGEGPVDTSYFSLAGTLGILLRPGDVG